MVVLTMVRLLMLVLAALWLLLLVAFKIMPVMDAMVLRMMIMFV